MKAGNAGAMVDVVPERYPYRDEGCDVSSSCLRCPLPQCKYDDPGWFHRQRRDRRDDEVIEAMREGGLSVADLAARFALSQRTVFRILRRAVRGLPPDGPSQAHA